MRCHATFVVLHEFDVSPQRLGVFIETLVRVIPMFSIGQYPLVELVQFFLQYVGFCTRNLDLLVICYYFLVLGNEHLVAGLLFDLFFFLELFDFLP